MIKKEYIKPEAAVYHVQINAVLNTISVENAGTGETPEVDGDDSEKSKPGIWDNSFDFENN